MAKKRPSPARTSTKPSIGPAKPGRIHWQLADPLASARKAAGLSHRELALRAGCEARDLAALEKAKAGDATLSHLVHVADALGMDVELRVLRRKRPLSDVALPEMTTSPADAAAAQLVEMARPVAAVAKLGRASMLAARLHVPAAACTQEIADFALSTEIELELQLPHLAVLVDFELSSSWGAAAHAAADPPLLISARYGSYYRVDQTEIASAALSAFAETVALFHVWLYFREFVATSTGFARLPPLPLSAFQVGQQPKAQNNGPYNGPSRCAP